MIKGTTVILLQQIETGRDAFNYPIYTEQEIPIDNVLVAPVSSDDVVSTLNLYGKKAVYQLGIPKTDSHVWENQKVRFFGKTFSVFGFELQGIEENIPLKWNRKVFVEVYG